MKYLKTIGILLVGSIIGAVAAVLVTTGNLLNIIFVKLFRDYDYREWLRRDLADCENILELGCGSNSPILQIGYGLKTEAIDIWQPYVDKHTEAGSYKSCRKADILDYTFGPKRYDAVVICDVLEHLQRKDVISKHLFTKMETAAVKKIIIFTPNGFVENDEVDGDPYQRHLSAWEPVDYRIKGYTVRGATGWRALLGKASLPKRPHRINAILAMLSMPIIYKRPELAWHSYAVKVLS